MKTPSPSLHAVPSEDSIRERAYDLWQSRGCPAGDDWQDWFNARTQLTAAIVPPPSPAAAGATPAVAAAQRVAARAADPSHRFHAPAEAPDRRLAVAASGTPQRIRGRHFDNAPRKQE